MRQFGFWVLVLLFLSVSVKANIAQAQSNLPIIDWQKRLTVEDRLTTFGSDLMGDSIDPNMGSLVFDHTDISLPGNNGLDVSIRRRLAQGYKYDEGVNVEFGDWELVVPKISAIALSQFGWDGQRCNGSWDENFPSKQQGGQTIWPPDFQDGGFPTSQPSSTLYRQHYMDGVTVVIPGQGSQTLLKNGSNGQFPTGTKATTVNEWYFTCTTATDGNEGFIGHAPNGHKYHFKKFISRPYKELGFASSLNKLPRVKVILAANHVEDQHGNYVDYTYSGDKLTKIESSDGRVISIGYSGDNLISSISANGRVWEYTYRDSIYVKHEWDVNLGGQTFGSKVLDKVGQPDLQYWEFDLDAMQGEPSPAAKGICGSGGPPIKIKHPYGARGDFKLRDIRHRQANNYYSQMILDCESVNGSEPFEPGGGGYNPPVFREIRSTRSLAVTSKKITLANSEELEWVFEYEEDDVCDIMGVPCHDSTAYINVIHSPANLYYTDPNNSGPYKSDIVYTDSGDDPLDYTNWTKITQPDGTVITYYHHWNYEEMFSGQLIKREVSKDAVLMDETDMVFVQQGCNGSGAIGVGVATKSSKCPTHMTTRKQQRNGDTFTSEMDYVTDKSVTDYSFGNPTATRSWSSYVISNKDNERETITTYEHNTDNWILGLPETVTRNNRLLSSMTYTDEGQVEEVFQYNQTQAAATYSYRPDGTIISVTTPVTPTENRVTQADEWHRGKPKLVTFNDNSTIGREVDDNGWIMSQTDAKHRKTTYKRDEMGRLERITPHTPLAGQGSKLPDTTLLYTFHSGGVVQMITKGSRRDFVYYDNLMRPHLEMTYTFSHPEYVWTNTKYDSSGRVVFKSQPSLVSNETKGIETEYDGLGRVIETRENVAPFATTTHEYLDYHRYKVTDPEGNAVTTYQYGWDGPDSGVSYLIRQHGITDTWVRRNVHGQIWRVDQTGTLDGVYHNQKQHFFYDGQQRLCRTRTPEGGDTAYLYDLAGQLTTYAKGLEARPYCYSPYGDSIVNLTYDNLGRLEDTLFADPNTPDIERAYDVSGNITELYRGQGSADEVLWNYSYDGNDQLLSEALVIGGASKTFDISYLYNSHGFMYRKYLPSGKGISYFNDGLGRHKKVAWGTGPNSIYADEAEYHPSGALASMTFGNGNVFTQTLNSRLQPQSLKVTSNGIDIQNLSYDYYADGRIWDKTDSVDSTYDATYFYDAAGRFKQSDSDAWGIAQYTYDPLGNLRKKEFNNNGAIRTVTNNYDANNRIIQSIDTANINYGFNYDTRGNVTTTGLLNFSYDMSDQPIAMSGTAPNTGTDVTASYLYDGNMKRVRSIVDSNDGQGPKTIYNVYDSGGKLVHIDEHTDDKETDYLHGMGQTLARIQDVGNGDVFTYLHPDHLGSPQTGTKEDGTVAFTEHYTPFGEALLNPAANDNQSGFTGHIKDADTGLNYMQARYYDPNIGRFLSVDPVGFMDTGNPSYFSRYAYTFNDPINLIDPDGMQVTITLRSYPIKESGGVVSHAYVDIRDTQSGNALIIRGGPSEPYVAGSRASTKNLPQQTTQQFTNGDTTIELYNTTTLNMQFDTNPETNYDINQPGQNVVNSFTSDESFETVGTNALLAAGAINDQRLPYLPQGPSNSNGGANTVIRAATGGQSGLPAFDPIASDPMNPFPPPAQPFMPGIRDDLLSD